MSATGGRGGERRRAWVEAAVALLVLAAVWALLFGLDPFADEQVNDRAVTRAFAVSFLDGELPYRDIPFEYPPLAAPVLALSGVFGTGEEAFRTSIGLVMLAFAAAVVLLCGSLAARTGGSRLAAMLAAALAPLLVGAVVRTHFDFVAVALTLAALLAIVAQRLRLGFLALGLGALVKVFPLAVAPVALAWLWGRGERRSALAGAAVLGATLIAGVGVAVALSPTGALDALRYQVERPPQVESSPAVAAYALDWIGAGVATPAASHRSNGIEHPAGDAISVTLGLALLGVVALLSLAAGRGGAGSPAAARARATAPGAGPRAPPEEARLLCLASLAAVAALAVLGKVLSPQFLTWTIPLLALAVAWRLYALAVLTAVASVLTLVEFPSHYFDLVAREPWAVAVVAIRDLALLAAVGLAVAATRRPGAAAAGSPSPARPPRPRPAPR